MYPEPTELLSIGCLTELTWTPRFSIKYVDSKHQLADVLSKGNFTPNSVTSCTKTMAKRMQEQEGEEKARCKVKAVDELGLTCLDKFFDCAESSCVEKTGDTQSTLSNRLVKCRETWRKRTQSRRSVEFPRMAKRCSSGRRYEETRRDRRRPGTPELSWRFSKCEETRRFRKLRNRRQWQSLATQSPFFNKLRAAHGEGFLDRETKIWSQPDGSKEGPRCEHSYMGWVYVCHSSSCSSSW